MLKLVAPIMLLAIVPMIFIMDTLYGVPQAMLICWYIVCKYLNIL